MNKLRYLGLGAISAFVLSSTLITGCNSEEAPAPAPAPATTPAPKTEAGPKMEPAKPAPAPAAATEEKK